MVGKMALGHFGRKKVTSPCLLAGAVLEGENVHAFIMRTSSTGKVNACRASTLSPFVGDIPGNVEDLKDAAYKAFQQYLEPPRPVSLCGDSCEENCDDDEKDGCIATNMESRRRYPLRKRNQRTSSISESPVKRVSQNNRGSSTKKKAATKKRVKDDDVEAADEDELVQATRQTVLTKRQDIRGSSEFPHPLAHGVQEVENLSFMRGVQFGQLLRRNVDLQVENVHLRVERDVAAQVANFLDPGKAAFARK